MPLIGTERDAICVLINKIHRDGTAGLNNFARLLLGAHADQARRLASIATDVSAGRVDLADVDLHEPETIQVTRVVDGKELALTLKADRLPITSYDELVAFYEIDTDIWKPTSQVFNFWGNENSPNFQVKAQFRRDEYQAASKEDRQAFREWAKDFAPDFNLPTPRVKSATGKMLELIISDLHVDRVGKRDEALDRMIDGATNILERVGALYDGLDEINLVFLGDTLNSDNGRDTTTNGTPQESEADWRDTFRQLREAVANIAIEAAQLSQVVNIHILPGNHDYERAFYLADSLWAFFWHNRDSIRVILNDSPRRYLRWGNSLIGLTHGDRLKPVDLAMTMFREQGTEGIEFFEWHLGHTHTRREDEVHGVTFQWFRTPSEPSEWEHKNLYGNNRRDITGIVWDEIDGPEATFRHSFRSDQ